MQCHITPPEIPGSGICEHNYSIMLCISESNRSINAMSQTQDHTGRGSDREENDD